MKVSSYLALILISGTIGLGCIAEAKTFEEAVLLATCYIERPDNLAYVKNCTNTTREVKYLTVEAGANATFVCRDVKYIVLKLNPGFFVIERRPLNGSWDSAIAINDSYATFRGLWPGEIYEFRIRRVFADGVSEPEFTDPIATMWGSEELEKVTNISLNSITVEATNPFRMRSEISFAPGADRPCFYEVHLWDAKNTNILIELINPVKFESVFAGLEFDMEYTIDITALTRLDIRSRKVAKAFRTPTCLQIYDNLTMCAPEEVYGFRVALIHKIENIFDVNVTWDKPKLLPDNYTVELLPLSSKIKKPFVHNVSGTATQTLFPEVHILDEYLVTIRASSSGGRGPQLVADLVIRAKDITPAEISFPSKVGNIFMILIGGLGLVLSSSACVCHWRNKKRLSRQRYFKDSTNDVIKDIGESGPVVIGDKEVLKPVDEWEIRPERLEIKRLLGSGAFGIVKLGSLRNDQGEVNIVAVKMLRDDPSEDEQRGFELEIKMMKSTGQHPNIVSLLGCCTIGPRPLLIVEYCSQGDLQTFLRAILAKATVWVLETKKQCVLRKILPENSKEDLSTYLGRGKDDDLRVSSSVANCAYDIDQEIDKPSSLSGLKDSFSDSGIVTEVDLLNFARQVATGMEFLSSNRVVHRDLAARNVLVCHDRTVKISDFGLSRDIYQENVYKKQSSGLLPVKWMAIEALTHQVYSTHSDVWSFGILLWEIVTLGSSPYPEIPVNKVLKRLKSGYRMERPTNCSLSLYNVMLSCWQAKPKDRPTFTILREELDKLICTAAENDYLDLNDVSKGIPPEEEDSSNSSLSYDCLPSRLTYLNDSNESRAARQDHVE